MPKLLVQCIPNPAQTPFDTQFFRANIDPTELYVLSLPGTAASRLSSHDSGFANLYLAGDWTLTDLNLGCIEATVISARMASRAICGKPDHICGAFGSLTPIVDAIPPNLQQATSAGYPSCPVSPTECSLSCG